MTRAEWQEEEGRWLLHTDRGDTIRCRWYVLAVGILNLMKLPAIAGMEDFEGRSFHTARWDYEYTGGSIDEPLTKLGDKVVALLGTGASGIQCVPPLVESAKHLYVFQRTPSAIGERGNRPTDARLRRGARAGLAARPHGQLPGHHAGPAGGGRPGRRRVDASLRRRQSPQGRRGHERADIARSGEETDFAVMEAHRRRVEQLVSDPVMADILKPYYRYICKRPCFHDEYLPAFNAPTSR